MDTTDVNSAADSREQTQAGPFRVSIAWFPPNVRIPSHTHEWACISVLMSGRFEQRFAGRILDCPAGAVLAKPPEERHVDRWFSAWSQHLIIEVDPDRYHELGPTRTVAEEIHHILDVGAELTAQAIWEELVTADSATPVAVEGLVLQLLARLQRRTTATTQPPAWLAVARDYLHDNFVASIQLGEVAREAGVHPDHLARVFGQTHRMTIGEYLRQLRVDAAATKLLSSEASIAEVADATGFADQSHLTRIFKRIKGVTPGRYRTIHGMTAK